MNTVSAILTDLDNTIYNWVDFYAPCFRAMVHVIARHTDTEEQQVTEQFKDVFTRFGSVEYPFSIQHLKLCNELEPERIKQLVYLGQMAFGRARRKHLKAYQGVAQTLAWASRNHITIVGVTNAPLYLAWRRLVRLGLSRFFMGVVAGEDFPVPDNDIYAAEYRSKVVATRSELRWHIRSLRKKPDPGIYEDILRTLALNPEKTWIVGDSLAKDVAPAIAVGANGIWARYGTQFKRQNYETILSITHWSKDQISSTYSEQGIIPTATIDQFSELEGIVETEQLPLLM